MMLSESIFTDVYVQHTYHCQRSISNSFIFKSTKLDYICQDIEYNVTHKQIKTIKINS